MHILPDVPSVLRYSWGAVEHTRLQVLFLIFDAIVQNVNMDKNLNLNREEALQTCVDRNVQFSQSKNVETT